MKNKSKINVLNECIYKQLLNILTELSKKINLKIYSVFTPELKKDYEVIRIKQILSRGIKEINQETINSLENITRELDIHIEDSKFESIDNLAENINHLPKKEINKENTNFEKNDANVYDTISNENEVISRLLYAKEINFEINKVVHKVVFIIEIRNIEDITSTLFHKFSDVSFIKMILDYFFDDHIEDNKGEYISINEDEKIDVKYNEDSTQFLRRMTRLYFGKLQTIIKKDISLEYNEIPLTEDNEYYINTLLEQIDDISTRTYEGSSPFGSLVMLNSNVLQKNNNIITYVIKFQSDDRIFLSNSKRIRKLLELTNGEKDLHLISDHEVIYGLGKINWNEHKNNLVLRFDFKGLSNFSCDLLTIFEKSEINGEIVFENNKAVFRSLKNIEIIPLKLLNVSFKSPYLGTEGYNSDKFIRVMKSQFSYNENSNNNEIDKLEKIVSSAKDQKHGTMVVITDYETALNELKTLKKQSTLIDRTIIEPEYIDNITAIDGAIYFDSFGFCHAVGVILDGIAREDIGDSSRGARYNSAYRYLQKLKEANKKCVIVIISEDGMVDVIPEIDDEEKLNTILNQLIDLIYENPSENSSKIDEIEQDINNYNNIDYHLYFKIAEAYRSKEIHEKVIEYLLLGISKANNNYVIAKYYRYLSQACYFKILSIDQSDPSFKEGLSEVIKNFTFLIDNYNKEDLIANDYNTRAISISKLGTLEINENESIKGKDSPYFHQALQDYSKALEMNPKSYVIFRNRSNLYQAMDMKMEALDDLLNAEILHPDQDNIDRIMKLIQSEESIFEKCMKNIHENYKFSNDSLLSKSLAEYLEQLKLTNLEYAVTLEDNYFKS